MRSYPNTDVGILYLIVRQSINYLVSHWNVKMSHSSSNPTCVSLFTVRRTIYYLFINDDVKMSHFSLNKFQLEIFFF